MQFNPVYIKWKLKEDNEDVVLKLKYLSLVTISDLKSELNIFDG